MQNWIKEKIMQIKIKIIQRKQLFILSKFTVSYLEKVQEIDKTSANKDKTTDNLDKKKTIQIKRKQL